ncbi:MAG TPA: MnhB domain-containing protein [Noviherbaspirillum sp.]
MTILLRALVIAGCFLLAMATAAAMLDVPTPSLRLADRVYGELASSGVTHPVTAVLLNFRGYDTLLEIAVLLLALLGVLTAAGGAHMSVGRARATVPRFLPAVVRLLAPLMILVAGYLLWAGSHSPGGAFQAGAVLAAGIVLASLACLLPERIRIGNVLRAALAGGFLVFLAVAAAGLFNGALLQYPVAYAGLLILLVETGLTLSLGVILASLFVALPDENSEEKE